MILPDRMFLAEWIRDPRLRRLPAHLQLLLLFLRHVCDRNGRFEFDAKPLHRALYESAQCGNVSYRDVGAWLEQLRAGDYIKSYTVADGRRVGEIAKEYWRQRLNYGKEVFDPPDELQPTLPFVASPAPPVVRKKPKADRVSVSPPSTHFTSFHFPEGIKGEAAPRAPAAPALGDLRLAIDCLPELVARYPAHDVPAQLRAATRYARRTRGDETAEVSMEFFTLSWMPRAPQRKERPAAPVPPALTSEQAAALAAAQAEQARQIEQLIAGPEPAPGTLDHAIWLEARKTA